MSAVRKSTQSVLKLQVDNGVNAKGIPVTATRTFDDFSGALTDDTVLEIGTALGALQSHEVAAVKRVDTVELAAEG